MLSEIEAHLESVGDELVGIRRCAAGETNALAHGKTLKLEWAHISI